MSSWCLGSLTADDGGPLGGVVVMDDSISSSFCVRHFAEKVRPSLLDNVITPASHLSMMILLYD